ncbi:MAG: hypothetical protein IPF92_04325 [Myxococcales bacterium]|nr:hypothetical protein [Myxococcales bacterium]MBL0197794.1 hypothetical protein [Myxococcales bacterium]
MPTPAACQAARARRDEGACASATNAAVATASAASLRWPITQGPSALRRGSVRDDHPGHPREIAAERASSQTGSSRSA